MDSQHILEQLASLRENLTAIESARQQVQNNVAEYEKVRLQLSDTANSIKSILDGFDAVVKEINAHQDSLLDDVNDSKAAILETLHKQANEIANQSQMSVESLKQSIVSLDEELSKATAIAIQQLKSTSSRSNQQLNDALDKIKGDFDKSVDSSTEALKACIESFKKEISSASRGFDQSANHTLNQLNEAIKGHLSKYQAFETKISEEIEKLSDERQKLEKFADKLNKTIETGFKNINEKLNAQTSQIEVIKSSTDEKLDSLASQIRHLASLSASQTEDVKGAIKKSMIISIIAVLLMLINLVVFLIR